MTHILKKVFLPFSILYFFFGFVSQAHALQIVTNWTAPNSAQSFAYTDNITFTGDWQLPDDGVGRILTIQAQVRQCPGGVCSGAPMYTYAEQVFTVNASDPKTGTFNLSVSPSSPLSVSNGGTLANGSTPPIPAGSLTPDSYQVTLRADWIEMCGGSGCATWLDVYVPRSFAIGAPPGPQYSYSPAPTLDFGIVPIGSYVDRDIDVTNIGGQPATLTVDNSGNYSCISANCSGGVTINPGNSQTVTVRFQPTGAAGTKTGSLRFYLDGTNYDTYGVTGYAASYTGPFVRVVAAENFTAANVGAPNPTISEGASGTVNYGTRLRSADISAATAYPITYTIYNDGSSTLNGAITGLTYPFQCLTAYSVSIIGCDPNISGSVPTYSIPAGQSAMVVLRFFPQLDASPGPAHPHVYTTPIQFTNDTTGGSVGVNQEGRSVYYPVLNTSILDFDFAGVPIGAVDTWGIDVSNPGSETMTLSAVFTGPFSGPGGCTDGETQVGCQLTLAPGASAVFDISYTPTTAGPDTGTLSWITNAPVLGTLTNHANLPQYSDGVRWIATRNLLGEGLELLIDDPNVQYDHNQLYPDYNYGNVVVGDTASHTFTIRNQGSNPTTGSVTITGVGFACTGVTGGNTCGNYTIPAGGTIDVTIDFAPGSPGYYQEYVTFSNSNGTDTLLIVVGNGVVPGLTVTPAPSYLFPEINSGENITRLFEVRNSGSGGTISGTLSFSSPGTFYCDADSAQVELATEYLLDDFDGPEWVPGRYGTALKFSGQGEYVEIPHSASISPTNQLAISAWVKSGRDDGVWGRSVLISKYFNYLFEPSVNSSGFFFYVNEIPGGGTYWRSVSISSITNINDWHHLVGTYDGTELRFYRDGVLITSTPYTGTLTNGNGVLRFGRDNAEYYDGILDEVRIYSRGLEIEDIQNLYRTNATNIPGLVGRWTFDEGSGTTVSDSSGNGNTGTFGYGAAWGWTNNNHTFSGGVMTVDPTGTPPQLDINVSDFSPSYDVLEMRYRSNFEADRQLSVYYIDNVDRGTYGGSGIDTATLIGDGTWHVLEVPVTNAGWINYNGFIDELRFEINGLSASDISAFGRTLEIDYIKFKTVPSTEPFNNCAFSNLRAGESYFVPITFAPVSGGSFTTDATFDAGVGGTQTVTLFGNARTGAQINVTPMTYDFGIVNAGSSTTTTFTIQNTGVTPLSGNVGDAADIVPQSAGTGLLGKYYDGTSFSTHMRDQVDATVDFNWGNLSPAAYAGTASPNDRFSILWEGKVEALSTGEYTFYGNANEGQRLWVNGQLLVDRWYDTYPPVELSGTISLVRGNKYDIRYEYYENWDGAEAHLSWSGPGISKQIIPTSQLYTYAQLAGDTGPAGTAFTDNPYYCDSGCSYNLNPGDMQTVTIRFAPDIGTGSVTPILKDIFFSGGGGAIVPLSGISNEDPILSVEVYDTSSGTYIPVANGATLDFGTVDIGDTSSKTFRITNTGNGPLDSALALLSPYFCSPAGTCNTTGLASGASQTFTVNFTPGASDLNTVNRQATFTNSNTGETVTVTLTGIGRFVPTISFGTQSFDFGDVRLGQTGTLNVVFKNAGSRDLAGEVTVSSPNFACTGPIGTSGNCEYNLIGANTSYSGSNPNGCLSDPTPGPYDCTTFTFTFTPAALGADSTDVNLSNPSGLQFVLTGNGVSGNRHFRFIEF